MEFAAKSVEHLRFVHFTVIITISALLIATLYDQNKLFDDSIDEIKTIRAITENTPSLNIMFDKIVELAVAKSEHKEIIQKYKESIHGKAFQEESFTYLQSSDKATFLERSTWNNAVGKLNSHELSKLHPQDLPNFKIDKLNSLGDFKLLWNAANMLKQFDVIIGRDTRKIIFLEDVFVNSYDFLPLPFNRESICSSDSELKNQLNRIAPWADTNLDYPLDYPSSIFNYSTVNCLSKKGIFKSYLTEVYMTKDKLDAQRRGYSPINTIGVAFIPNTHKSIEIDVQEHLIKEGKIYQKLIKGSFDETFPNLSYLSEKYPLVKFDEMSIYAKETLSPLQAIVSAMKASTSNVVSILSINFPAGVIFPWGAFVLMIILLYFSMHLNQLTYKSLQSLNQSVSWIGIYKDDDTAKFITLLSLSLLPIITTLIMFLYDPADGIPVNGIYSILIFSILYALTLFFIQLHVKEENSKSLLTYLINVFKTVAPKWLLSLSLVTLIYIMYLYERHQLIGYFVTISIVLVSLNIFRLFECCWEELNFD